ncbi:hypothetical protein ElyMa_001058900 [Elysia marginata]|uniref:Uncharacterized protein n=1 Tax=Elysia marginata TaxID=1093978 RepID=A0AAV4HP30_9GAST|nr:hypothetical protein ElyMa_001058900 [Elysia marginata]
MCRGWKLNPRPPDHRSDALTTDPRCSTEEIRILSFCIFYTDFLMSHSRAPDSGDTDSDTWNGSRDVEKQNKNAKTIFTLPNEHWSEQDRR